MKILGKVSKDGEYSSPTIHRNKIKRIRPLTPEEKKYIINHFKNLGLISKPSNLPLEKEIEPIKQEIHKKKLKFFCNHKDIIIKNGYTICRDCGGFVKVKDRIDISK